MSGPPLLACAILFEPTVEQVQRVCRQIADLGCHAAIHDNSVTPESRAFVHSICAAQHVYLSCSGSNVGTAGGLNALLRHAAHLGVPWLVYFDQDSILPDGYGAALSALEQCDREIAIVGTRYTQRVNGEPVDAGGAKALHEVRFVIASGAAMRISALLSVDGFDQRMFLDVVDHEICMRLRSAGWRLLVDDSRVMQHEIGEDARRVVNGIRVSRHPTWRRRQMWRNSMFLVRRYSRDQPRDCAIHLAVRWAETMGGAFLYRDARYVSSALAGAAAGLVKSSKRQGLSATFQDTEPILNARLGPIRSRRRSPRSRRR